MAACSTYFANTQIDQIKLEYVDRFISTTAFLSTEYEEQPANQLFRSSELIANKTFSPISGDYEVE